MVVPQICKTYSAAAAGSRLGNFLRAHSVTDRDRRGRRESVPLGLAAEVHLDRDVPAVVAVDMAVPVDFEHLQRQVDIDGFVFIDAVLDLGRLLQGLFAFADEHENPVLALRDHLDPNQHLPQGVAEGGGGDLGLDALAVQKMFDFLAFHSVLPRFGGARREANPLRAAGQSANVYFVCVGNVVVED